MFRTKLNSTSLQEKCYPLFSFNEELVSMESIKEQFWGLILQLSWKKTGFYQKR